MNTASPSSAESSASSSINTSTDRKLDSTKYLYALRDRLGDVNQILDDLCLLVRECDTTRNDLLEKVSFVETHVIEFIKTAMNDIHSTAKVVAPMASVGLLHQRKYSKKNNAPSTEEERILRHLEMIRVKNNSIK
jgi:hypothetical protein